MNTKTLVNTNGELFREMFGKTPLKARLDDILKESIELSRFTDIASLKDETGDLLCSLLALCYESGFNAEDLILHTHNKIRNRSNQYKTLGRKTKIALLGGSFNPVTKAHINIANFVLSSCNEFDEVWLVPCFNSLYGKTLVNAQQRLHMCNLAVKNHPLIKVFDYEIKHQLKGETFHFMNKLISDKEYENFNFSFIIGMDSAKNINKWINSEMLMRLTRFVVVPRDKEKIENSDMWFLNPPHIFLNNDVPMSDISSTKVRHVIKSGLVHNILDMIEETVYNYILDNGLYIKE
jgi:nicotinate-nucleotide adenylyltransferase